MVSLYFPSECPEIAQWEACEVRGMQEDKCHLAVHNLPCDLNFVL